MNWWQKEQLIYHKNLGLLVNLWLLLCTLLFPEKKKWREEMFLHLLFPISPYSSRWLSKFIICFHIVISLLLKQSFFCCKQENIHVFRDKCEKKSLRITWEKNREGRGSDRREREWRETEGRGKKLRIDMF
jgi:hypothetical protein